MSLFSFSYIVNLIVCFIFIHLNFLKLCCVLTVWACIATSRADVAFLLRPRCHNYRSSWTTGSCCCLGNGPLCQWARIGNYTGRVSGDQCSPQWSAVFSNSFERSCYTSKLIDKMSHVCSILMSCIHGNAGAVRCQLPVLLPPIVSLLSSPLAATRLCNIYLQ
jgi:hypothetical protein